MIDKNELEVLSSFFPKKKHKTISEIKNSCNYSYERIYSALQSLKKKNIVKLKKMYGNVIIAALNYKSPISLMGFVYYSIKRKNNFFNLDFSKFNLPDKKKDQILDDLKTLETCISEIEDLNSELISIIEISTIPKNKIKLVYIGDNKLKEELMKLEIRYNVAISPIKENEESFLEKRNNYLDSVVIKGFEKFYRLVYLHK